MQLVVVTEENIPTIAQYCAPTGLKSVMERRDEVLGLELTLGFRRDNFLAKGNTHYIIELDTFKKMWANRWKDEEKFELKKAED